MDKIGYFALLLTLFCYAHGTSRIYNAGTTNIESFPHAISLQRLPVIPPPPAPPPPLTPIRGHECGGALLNMGHGLTSARCCFEHNLITGVSTPRLPNEFRVFAGATMLSNDTSPNQWRNIHQFVVHPGYTRPPSNANDIAVIVFSTPFLPAPGLVPIRATSFNPPEGSTCRVAGWGGYDIGEQASVSLRFAEKYIYSHQICNFIYTMQPGVTNVFPTMICAAAFDFTMTSTTTDRGNVLVCGNNIAVGVLSYFPGLNAQSMPELYTRTSNYTTWIYSIAGAGNVTPGIVILGLAALIHMIFHLY